VAAPAGLPPLSEPARDVRAGAKLCERALDELGSAGRLVVQLATRREAEAEGATWWNGRVPTGWASPFAIFLREDVLGWDDDALANLLAEECAHWALEQANPMGWDSFVHELFAAWFLYRSSLAHEWEPPNPLDPGDAWEMGRAVGAAAAGETAARTSLEALDADERAAALALVSLLDGIDEPREFVAVLAGHQRSGWRRSAAR
jgi:hypothetical protein